MVITDRDRRVVVRKRLLNQNDPLGFERVLGNRDLLSVNYLGRGLLAAKSVARVHIKTASGTAAGLGTCFLIAPGLMLTNHHVLSSAKAAAASMVEFDFEDDIHFVRKRPYLFRLAPDKCFFTHAALDFTVCGVAERSQSGKPITSFGYLELIEVSGKALEGERVTIIQHPNGEPKQIVLRENRVVDYVDGFVRYRADTERGSSGSPVFNDQWQVVALHHSSVPRLDEDGRTLARNGSLWSPALGDGAIDWIANEGVRISAVFEALRQAATEGDGTAARIIDTLVPADPAQEVAPDENEAEDRICALEAAESLNNRSGYDPDFLGLAVPLPALTDEQREDLAPRRDGGFELTYTHFSVVMSRSRRLARFTACNIDGNRLQRGVSRRGTKWRTDPRLDMSFQSDNDLYRANDLDRGHLVRRRSPVWGPLARQANQDTFFYTNAAPQHARFNQKTWLDLEDFILRKTDRHQLKITVFTGPIFRPDDPWYGEERRRGPYQLPLDFWKVVVMRLDHDQLRATAYQLSQRRLVTRKLEFAFGDEPHVYQVPVSLIEELTELDFGPLRDADPLQRTEATEAIHPINGIEDILL
ncbi:MAG: DNA/RNA non-specific endonuclease [Geminicoccaceae bacterium]